MCQTENEPTAGFCRLCHARLPEAPPDEPEIPEASEAPAGEVIPDWLARLRKEVSGEAVSDPAPEPTAEAPDLGARPEAELGWLGDLPQVSDQDEGPPEGEVPGWVGGDEPAEGEIPEWLGKIRAKARETGEPPDDRTTEPLDLPEEPEAAEPAPPSAAQAEEEAPESLGLPDWLLGSRPDDAPTVPPGPAEAERPAWLEGVTDDPSRELPRVPALVFHHDQQFEPASPEVDLPSISAQVPDWIGDSRPAEGQEKPDLAPATLPAWLEAMRPVDTFRSVIEFDAAEDQAVESAGPLAGLRGVLLAEPVVAMPRASSGAGPRVDVNERQYAQAELLHRLVDEERREVRPRPVARRRPDILRWFVGAALLVAVGIPAILGTPSLPLPAFAPRDLANLIALVDGLPTERPALVVFDYDSSATGEMEAVSAPLLSHLMSRGMRIATLSTRPGGSVLAERLMAQVGAQHAYLRGEDFVHLGYLPGGPAAVQLFADQPRLAVATGFLEDETFGTVWASPVLSGITQLVDFGLLVVITSGSEDARAWIEQAEPKLGESPLVTAVGAGAEPLVRPYYESTSPKLDGVLSGLTSATAYEQRLGQAGLAQSRWSAYGTGLLTAELLLGIGASIALLSAGLRARRG